MLMVDTCGFAEYNRQMFKTKTQVWLADRIKWVQYPNINKVDKKPDWKRHGSSMFIESDQNSNKARLSFFGNIVLLFYGLIAGIIGLIVIGIGLVILWAIISSFF